jgi:soluble lytic murein transglycosylase-like protein
MRLALTLLLAFAPRAHAMMLPGIEGGRSLYLPMVVRAAAALGLPAELADAVAMVETGYRPDAVGSSGEIGLMQIMPATALQLGFHGTLAELADPQTNIRLGTAYLARAWAAGGGDICRSLMKYRAGLGQELMTPLSVRYCTRAIAWLSGTGSRLADGVTLPDGTAAPPPATDPYVIAVVPALAAQARLRPILATAHEMVAAWRPRHARTIAEREQALNDRFLSHQRHLGGHAPAPPDDPPDE